MSSLLGVSLMPHPPIVVPEVGKENIEKCKLTYENCTNIALDIVKNNPELLIVITPHSQAYSDAYSVYTFENLALNFNQFVDWDVKLNFNNSIPFLKALTDTESFTFAPYQFPVIDHGAGVPLYFLHKAGFKGNVCIINYSFESNKKLVEFGKYLANTINSHGKKTHIIASGDMSHRLLKEGPYGFKQEGVEFDKLMVEIIKTKEYKNLLNIDSAIRQEAGECGYNSLMIAMGALDFIPFNNKFYSYEAPFGVGYLVANL